MYPELTMKNSRQSHHPRQKREQKKKDAASTEVGKPDLSCGMFLYIYLLET